MNNPKLILNQEELWYHRTHETSNAEIKDHKTRRLSLRTCISVAIGNYQTVPNYDENTIFPTVCERRRLEGNSDSADDNS